MLGKLPGSELYSAVTISLPHLESFLQRNAPTYPEAPVIRILRCNFFYSDNFATKTTFSAKSDFITAEYIISIEYFAPSISKFTGDIIPTLFDQLTVFSSLSFLILKSNKSSVKGVPPAVLRGISLTPVCVSSKSGYFIGLFNSNFTGVL